MRSDGLSPAGVGADGPPHIYTGTRQEAKIADKAAYVIAGQQVRVQASDADGAHNHSIPAST